MRCSEVGFAARSTVHIDKEGMQRVYLEWVRHRVMIAGIACSADAAIKLVKIAGWFYMFG